MKIIDLSYPINHAMPVFPGDPPVEFSPAASVQESGYSVTRVCVGTHVGTHVDAPRHRLPDGPAVDSLPLERLVGRAEVLDLGKLPPRAEITAETLAPFVDRVRRGCRLLIKTSWGRRWPSPEFFTNFPGILPDAAWWLIDRKVALLGIEQPSVHAKLHQEVHTTLLSAGVILIETMANFHQLTRQRVRLIALPMKLAGLDGAPVRAIAIER